MKKKLVNAVVFFLCTYPAGIVIGLVFWTLRFAGILRVRGWGNFPNQRGRILLVSNHPTLVEPILLIGLFFHQYLFRPFKYGPWTLADRKNYFDNWKYWLMRTRLIPVDRGNEKGDVRSLIVAKRILSSGANIILFPEGGRTWKGDSRIASRCGKMIRPLKGGLSMLATDEGVTTLPVWFEFRGWISMKLVIGKPVCFEKTPREEVTHRVERILLELADAT